MRVERILLLQNCELVVVIRVEVQLVVSKVERPLNPQFCQKEIVLKNLTNYPLRA